MSAIFPFTVSQNNYRLKVPIDNSAFLLDVRFNSFDSTWSVDLYEEDETPILMNIKLVLGARLGRTCKHSFFDQYVLSVVDTSGSGVDANFDDLGNRVQLRIIGDSTDR